MQRARVAAKKPLKQAPDGDALTAAQQTARNKAFMAALTAIADGLTYDGAGSGEDARSDAVQRLLYAFPDNNNQDDGRGWLPLHWAVASTL